MTGAPRPAAAAMVLLIPGQWAEDALCAQTDPDLWYPELGGHAQAALARRICGICPVRAECLDYALAGADTWNGSAFDSVPSGLLTCTYQGPESLWSLNCV